MSATAVFKEQQRAYGFDTAGIEQMSIAASGSTTHDGFIAMLKRLAALDSPATADTEAGKEGLTLQEVLRLTGLSHADMLHQEGKEGFPACRRLTRSTYGWLRSEVEEYIAGKRTWAISWEKEAEKRSSSMIADMKALCCCPDCGGWKHPERPAALHPCPPSGWYSADNPYRNS